MWRQQHINLLGSPSSCWRLEDSSLMFLSALNFLGLDGSASTRLQGITPWYWWRPYFWRCKPKKQLHQATLYCDVTNPLALVNLKWPTQFLTRNSQYALPKNLQNFILSHSALCWTQGFILVFKGSWFGAYPEPDYYNLKLRTLYIEGQFFVLSFHLHSEILSGHVCKLCISFKNWTII
jgi:hypothetical protein